MKHLLFVTILLIGIAVSSTAQEPEQFSIATLNVDGLPPKVLVLKINSDGPGDAGSARIGKYLAQKGYDLVLMQEDFNYHDVITVLLEDDYKFDTWSGDVGLEGHQIDFLHLQNHRFECDGLMACWKKDISVNPSARTAWEQNFGKFSHANDEMVTKGYRRYNVTLKGGTSLLVYNMHMDASDDVDEAENNDTKDRAARMAQWAQLKADIMGQLGTLPIVIVGDMNSLYGRDAVKSEFIDAINESGRGTVSDVWVEMQQNGAYPTAATNGETLDKILYINPATGTQIMPVSYSLDTTGYMHDGKPLGDHFPVAATFIAASDKSRLTGITPIIATETIDGDGHLYDLSGKRVDKPHHGINVNGQGEKYYTK